MFANRNMLNSRQFHQGFLSATSMKLIALFCMTVDHVGAYGCDIPIIDGYIDECRIIGRIAAPIFVYTAVESLKKTKNKKRYLCRLYLASLVIGIANLSVTALFGMTVYFGNMVQSLFLTTFFLRFLETDVDLYQKKQYKKFLLFTIAFSVSIFGVTLFDRIIWNSNMLHRLALSDNLIELVRRAANIFIIAPRRIVYLEWIIILSIIWYFTDSRKFHIGCFLVICVLLLLLSGGNQWLMILATPIILLYNGEYGKGGKWFFYTYYPIHCYIIAGINTLY